MENNLLDPKVGMIRITPSYPSFPYPENSALKQGLRELFEALGLNPENPFKDYIRPGELALIKPNWVRNFNPLGHDTDSLVTHSSLIHALAEEVAKAMEGRGTLVIGDAPLQNCDFEDLLKKTKMDQVVGALRSKYPKLSIEVEDWRLTRIKSKSQTSSDDFGEQTSQVHRIVDMGKESFLEEVKGLMNRFRVTRYKSSLMQRHHHEGKHEYLVTGRIFEADFILNVSKMKTHIKAGLTGALKSLIGINGHKEYLPHHIKGPYFKGGDNYCWPNRFYEWYEDVYDTYWEHFSEWPRLKRFGMGMVVNLLENLARLSGWDGISAGSWRGNETVWRTTLDLNHLLYFKIDKKARKILNIVDGIIAGEGEGPLSPSPKPVGILVGGENPATVDAVLAKLMGYNLARIPTVYHALTHRRSRFAGIILEEFKVNGIPFEKLPDLDFKKPHYWAGA